MNDPISGLVVVSLTIAMGFGGLFLLRVLWEISPAIFLYLGLPFIPAVLFKTADAVRFVKQLIRR